MSAPCDYQLMCVVRAFNVQTKCAWFPSFATEESGREQEEIWKAFVSLFIIFHARNFRAKITVLPNLRPKYMFSTWKLPACIHNSSAFIWMQGKHNNRPTDRPTEKKEEKKDRHCTQNRGTFIRPWADLVQIIIVVCTETTLVGEALLLI